MSEMPSYEEALQYMTDAVLYQHIDFAGTWQGWKLRGRELVSPDKDRITPQRLLGLLWRDEMELRLAGFASRKKAEQAKQSPKVRVLVVDLQEYREHGVAAA